MKNISFLIMVLFISLGCKGQSTVQEVRSNVSGSVNVAYCTSKILPLFNVIFTIFLSGMLMNCKNEKPYIISCMDGNIDFQILGKSLDQAPFVQNVSDKDTVSSLIIQTEDDYYHYVTSGNSLPVINFNEKTLLAGRSRNGMKPLVIGQEVNSNCTGKTITFRITMTRAGQSGGFTSYFAIIPKISSETKVNFQPIYTN